MIDTSTYRSFLTTRGDVLGYVRRNQSDMIINATFTNDPTYKRVYILTPDGWQWEDAKYQFHFAQSIAKDDVDYYLQFRPKVHYPIGCYVLIPDDTDPVLELTEDELANPFLYWEHYQKRMWMIVERDNQNAYVRYNVLPCNHVFKWIYDGQKYSILGSVRAANSYTSGQWVSEYSVQLDNLTGFWIPNTYYLYKERLQDFHLDDCRTIMHHQRFFLTDNALDPKVYKVTKVIELSPEGIIKFNVKQDEFNPKTDNYDEMICNYYTEMGDMVSEVTEYLPSTDTFVIREMYRDENNELVQQEYYNRTLYLGQRYFYQAQLLNHSVISKPVWNIKLVDESGIYSDEDKKYYEGLIKMVTYDDNTVEVKPSKAGSLIGKKFLLVATDVNGAFESEVWWEVSKDAT